MKTPGRSRNCERSTKTWFVTYFGKFLLTEFRLNPHRTIRRVGLVQLKTLGGTFYFQCYIIFAKTNSSKISKLHKKQIYGIWQKTWCFCQTHDFQEKWPRIIWNISKTYGDRGLNFLDTTYAGIQFYKISIGRCTLTESPLHLFFYVPETISGDVRPRFLFDDVRK